MSTCFWQAHVGSIGTFDKQLFIGCVSWNRFFKSFTAMLMLDSCQIKSSNFYFRFLNNEFINTFQKLKVGWLKLAWPTLSETFVAGRWIKICNLIGSPESVATCKWIRVNGYSRSNYLEIYMRCSWFKKTFLDLYYIF